MSINTENINYDDFKNTCRICMFNCDIKFYLDCVVSSIFHKLTGLHFQTNDDLPKQICRNCYKKINEIQKFVFQCQRTHDTLMKCLNNYKQVQLKQEFPNKEQDAPENSNIADELELVLNLGNGVVVKARSNSTDNHKMEINENIELDEGIISETSEIEEEVIENTDLQETNFNLEQEITIIEHQIEFVKDERIIDETSEVNNEQNIIKSDDDFFTSNTSNVNSGSDEDSNYNYTSTDESVSNYKNSDVLPKNLIFSNSSNDPNIIISEINKKKDSNEKETEQNKTSGSNKHKRSYKCTKCSKSFARPKRLEVHKRTHTGERPFKCNQCSKSFMGKDFLKSHMRTHSSERPFKCDNCSKSFKGLSNMKLHMRTHSAERLFKCDQCSKSFIQSHHMKVHMRTHTGERPFQCNQCSKSFSRLFSLKTHMRTHTGELPFKCNHCSKLFNQLSNMKRHINIGKCNI